MAVEVKEVPPWMLDIEGPALDIAAYPNSPLRVAAGPGTGKTFALMRRIARLLHEGADPERIFVVTFTRTAARDLIANLRNLGIEAATRVQAGTLHSYCFRVLSREAILEVTGRNPRPLLKHEERVLQADLQRTGEWGIRQSRALLSAFEAAWARLQRDEPGWPRTADERRFQAQLLQWLRVHNAMLIGELVPEMRRHLRDNPGCDELAAFDHVLVDEYQDLNRADQDLIDRLATNGTLTVIGDEDQAIYTQLRYAQPEGIRDFHRTHPATYDVPLTECRRCPRRVVAIANAVIANNAARAQRALVPREDRPEGRVEVLRWRTMEDETAGLAHMIGEAIIAGTVERGQVLMLAPRRPIGYGIRDALLERGVPAHSYFTEEALDTPLAQERFTLLNLLAHPTDPVALRAWLSFGHNQYAAAPYSYLRAHCDRTGEPLHVAADQLRRGTLALPHSAHLQERLRLLAEESDRLRERRGAALVDELFPLGQQDVFLVRGLALAAVEDAADELDAADLLDDLRVRIIQPELPEAGDFVRIMSLHKSKGLTADMVVIAGCAEGWIPTITGDTPAERTASLEEQRRLFYVALTRAREILVVSSFDTMPLELAHRMQVGIRRRTRTRAHCLGSQFLAELGPIAPEPRIAQPGFIL